MKNNSKRFVLALLVAVLGTVAFMFFGIGPEEVDKFFVVSEKYVLFPLGIMVALGFMFHQIFPTKKLCATCGSRLTGLLSPKLFKFYEDASKNRDRKSLMKAMYICDNCGDAFSPRLKKVGNLNN